jgi:hypothetical protein
MRVERYFHVRRGNSTHGGATVRVVGDTSQVGQVDVQVAFCSKKDNFCKHVGRETANKQPIKVVPLRYLPQELARIGAKADKIAKGQSMAQFQDYTFSIKYFLPKE